ncbi:MAG TPA: polysaccharide deacetylase family protein [Myxococcales bacterium]|nr:polysaccharide deacetylase family protein [Myxococcales bacterium]
MRLALAFFAATACRAEVPVLLYHEVGCGTHDARDVPAAQLDEELSWLEGHGYHYVTARDALTPGAALPAQPVAITFDDGAACLYSAAFPVLQKHHAPFELFLVSGWVTADPASRHLQKLEDGEEVSTLVWPEVAVMARSGLASLGAHGRGHLYLRRLGGAALTDEVAGSRQDVAAAAGAPVDLFAYPFGAFDSSTLEAVRLSGYAGAYAVGVGPGGTFAYRRRSVHRGLSDDDFARLLSRRWIFPLWNHD